MDRIKKLKVKKQDGTFSDYIPIGADAENIDTADGESVEIKLNKKPYYYNTVADMKADNKLKVGDMAITLGYYEADDGGGAEYKIVDDTLIDDGGSVHKLSNGLFAKLIYNNQIIVNQFGAKNDGLTNNYDYLSTAIKFSYINKIQVKFLSGVYAYSGVIDIPKNQNGVTLIGTNEFTTIIQTLDDNSQIVFNDFLRSRIENIRFISTGTENVPMIYLPGTCHLSEFNNCTFATNMGVNIGKAAYLKFNDCSFSRQTSLAADSTVSYLVKTTSNGSEYLYFMNCYFEGASSTDECSPVQILGGHEIYFDNCDFCNWYGGNGLQLGGNKTLKHVHIANSTFVRNNVAILCKTNSGITGVSLDNVNVYLLTQNESKIIYVTRDNGTTGVLSDIHGNIEIDSTYALSGKQMFTADVGIQGGKINVYSNINLFPTSNIAFTPIYQPIFNIYQSITISGSSNTITKVLTTNSPFKDINLPTIRTQVTNGTGPTNITVNNTFGGNLELVMTFTSSSPWCQMYIDFKY